MELDEHRCCGSDVGFGAITVISNTTTDDTGLKFAKVVTENASQANGSFTIENCPLSVKMEIDVFSDVGSSLQVMRRIKNEYDPSNTLNPGRFVGRI